MSLKTNHPSSSFVHLAASQTLYYWLNHIHKLKVYIGLHSKAHLIRTHPERSSNQKLPKKKEEKDTDQKWQRHN